MAPVKKCFVALEAALYLLFLALDAFSVGGDGVKSVSYTHLECIRDSSKGRSGVVNRSSLT